MGAFIDGYHCNQKIQEKRRRKMGTFKNIAKNLELIKKLHETEDVKEQNKLIKNLEFVPSSGYSHYLEQSLTSNGCTVFRGSNNNKTNVINDIDRDIAQFVVDHNHKVYGIMSSDTDYFGFFHLPKHIKLIQEFHTKTIRKKDDKKEKKKDQKTQKNTNWRDNKLSKQCLTLIYYHSSELW